MAIEEPHFETITMESPFEIRHYDPILIAETTIEGDMDEASNKGFRLIADFIFGNNQESNFLDTSKLGVATPITQSPNSVKIAMTAPVTVEAQTDETQVTSAKQWRIQFVMPSKFNLATIPRPKNDAVRLREVPAKYFVVMTYSGFNTLSRVQSKTNEALEWTKKKSLQIVGIPQLSRYNPPWTLPMFRRNEIMIEIAAPSNSN